MAITMRASLSGYDALTETDKTKYSIYGDEDNILIKENARGSGTVGLFSIGTVSHNLGYIPFYLAYTEIGSGTYQVANSFDPFGAGWRVYSSTADLMFSNQLGSTTTNYKYYVFNDNMEDSL
jgi:hypothetical protein